MKLGHNQTLRKRAIASLSGLARESDAMSCSGGMVRKNQKYFGGYERLERIAVGGQAEVWKARRRTTGDLCALKLMPELSVDDRKRARFFREANALLKPIGDHVVQLFDVCPEDTKGALWYAMELAPDGSLRSRIGTDWKFEERYTAFLHTCLGVLESHNAGVIHRDIKPDNVLCFPGPTFKVADFGLLRNETRDTTTLTTTQQIIGTMQYWAPEMYKDPRNADRRTDIYALGVVLYEMLNGDRPLLQGVPVDDIAQDIQEPYRELIPRLLHPRSERRFQTVDELLKALAEAERSHAQLSADIRRQQVESALKRWNSLNPDELFRILEDLRRIAPTNNDRLVVDAFDVVPRTCYERLHGQSPSAFEELVQRTAVAIPKLKVPFAFSALEGYTRDLVAFLPRLGPDVRARVHDALVWMAFDFKRGEVRKELANTLWSTGTREQIEEFAAALTRSSKKVQADGLADLQPRTKLSMDLREQLETIAKSLT